MLGTVTPGREHYCPVLARQLAAMWPSHPPLWYALPAGRTAPYERTLATDATTWTGTLLAGLELLGQRTDCSHVFMLLEDHVPLWPCDVPLVEGLFDVAIREELRCLFFLKWEWPWDRAEFREEPDGRIRGWRRIDIVDVGGYGLARMPDDSLFYNQCQPALWDLGYYTSVVRAVVESGITDPWAFETFRMPDQPPHYVAPYRWPSRAAGYRRRGSVDVRALYTMKLPESRELRDMLVAERFPYLGPSAHAALGSALAVWGNLRGMSRRYAPSTRPDRRPS